mgnify:CR=1 FL=1
MQFRLKEYIENSKRIRQSYNNPLKHVEKLALKDELERQFYDDEATPFLQDFKTEVFLYDPNEEMPLSHKYFYSQLQEVEHKRILDIGCGYGFTSVNLAKRGAVLSSIDISPKMIELTIRNAVFNHVDDKITAEIMSAQNMQFKDNTFDYVVGFGILHHLNLDLAGNEIARVLKPGGRALFIEPRIPFKFLIFVRSLLPHTCFESPGGSQLTDKEIDAFASHFTSSQIKYFLFLRKLSRFPFFKKFANRWDQFDVALIKRFPTLKTLYWAFVIDVRN